MGYAEPRCTRYSLLYLMVYQLPVLIYLTLVDGCASRSDGKAKGKPGDE